MTAESFTSVAAFDAAAYADRLAELASRYDVPGASLAVYAGGQHRATGFPTPAAATTA
ncbi:MAG: hypothetical protein LC789_17725 [Actinobacteria bacterium]|nr:hypothetical protein [Actinomycetota bacterium]